MKLPGMYTGIAGFILLFFPGADLRAQQVVEAWVQRYNHAAAATDKAHKVATDSEGNFFVAGETHTGSSGVNMLLIKFSGSGIPLWTNQYDGPQNADDIFSSLAVDQSNNVYIAGRSSGLTGYDYVTIAYSGSGTPLWTNRYTGSGTDYDQVTAMAVGSNDGVYVTGISSGAGNSDYVTIAYSRAGLPLWTNRYNGSGNGPDIANGLTVDGNGNVFVTGYATGAGSAEDFVTIAYSGAGLALWTNRYSSPTLGSHDYANAIAVDGNGNVYVTGYASSASSLEDYLTIAYSNAGTPLWTNRYNGPANSADQAQCIAVDKNNDIIVTGQSVGSLVGFDYATLAYSSAGTPLWTNRFNGAANAADIPSALVLDGNNNVYVTGRSPTSGTTADYYDYMTVAYSSTGSLLWLNRYSGPGNFEDQARGIAVGTNNTVYVTGYSYRSDTFFDWITIGYSSSGVSQWTNRFNGPENRDDYGSAVAVDGNNNIYVTGVSFNNGATLADYATLAYSSDGVALWTNRYNGLGNLYDMATAIAVDQNNQVYVTGYAWGNGTSNDIVTIAYSSLGLGLWTNRFNGAGNHYDAATAIVVDGSNNVVVTGTSVNSATNNDFLTIAYSSAGVPLWTNGYNGLANLGDGANAAAVDGNNNVYVAGYSTGVETGLDYATIAYSNAGVPLWTNRYNAFGSSSDQVFAIAVDGDNNVYVTGSWFVTIAYSSAGVPLWTNRYLGQGQANALAIDADNHIYVTGQVPAAGGTEDYVTIAYSSAGMPLWTNRYNGPGNGNDRAQGVVVDASNRVYVTGYSMGVTTDYDFTTLVYASNGVSLSTNRYNSYANGADAFSGAKSIALASDGVVVVGGSQNDYALVKYLFPSNQPPVGSGFAAVTTQGELLSIPTVNLMTGVSDPDGGLVTLVSVSSLSTNGAAVIHTNATVTYIPAGGFVGADRFSYVVSDELGATNILITQIAVLPVGARFQRFTSPVLSPGSFTVNFSGIPGDSWSVYRAAQLGGPWNYLGNMLIPATGLFPFQDLNPPPAAAFYRASKP